MESEREQRRVKGGKRDMVLLRKTLKGGVGRGRERGRETKRKKERESLRVSAATESFSPVSFSIDVVAPKLKKNFFSF